MIGRQGDHTYLGVKDCNALPSVIEYLWQGYPTVLRLQTTHHSVPAPLKGTIAVVKDEILLFITVFIV